MPTLSPPPTSPDAAPRAAGTSLAVAGADPYPWPYDAAVPTTRLAVVLAGWDTHWRARSLDAPAVAARAEALAATLGGAGALVVCVHHARPARAPADAPDPEPLPPPGRDAVTAAAQGLDACWGGPLDAVLRRHGRTHVVLGGFGLEGPVHSTLRALNDRGYECLLVPEAAAALDAATAASAAHSVCMSGGIFGAIAGVDDVVAGLSPQP